MRRCVEGETCVESNILKFYNTISLGSLSSHKVGGTIKRHENSAARLLELIWIHLPTRSLKIDYPSTIRPSIRDYANVHTVVTHLISGRLDDTLNFV